MNKYSEYVVSNLYRQYGQTLYRFPNGYGASVIRNGFAYDGHELAVIKWHESDYDLCYDTPITDDVIGHLDCEEELELLEQIFSLASHTNNTTKEEHHG